MSIVKGSCFSGIGGFKAKVFYLKMIGDYYWYTPETTSGIKYTEIKGDASKYYKNATML